MNTNIISDKIAGIRFWMNTLAILEDSSATLAARADAAKVIFADDPTFWAGVVEMVTVAVVKPQPQPQTQPKVTTTGTAPARTLEMKLTKTAEERRDMWVGILESFVNGGHIDFEKTSKLGTEILDSGVVMKAGQWGTVFSAMQLASEKKLRLFNKDLYPKILTTAPFEPLSDFVFGIAGALDLFKVALAEAVSPMTPQLVGQGYALAAAVDEIDCRMKDEGKKFSQADADRIDYVGNEVIRLAGPEKLVRLLFGEGEGDFIADTHPAEPPTLTASSNIRIKGDLSAVVKLANPPANGIPPAPMMEVGPPPPPPVVVSTETASVN